MKRLALLSIFLALPAAAQDNTSTTATPSTATTCTAEDPNCADASLSLTFAGMAVITGETPTEVKPTAFIEAEMPLPFKGRSLGRAFARVGISTSPGAATDAASVLLSAENFQSVEGGGGIMRYIGQTIGGVSKWAVLGEVGFRTRRPDDPAQPVQASSTYWGAGFRFAHANGSQITIIGGQDGELGDSGAMQTMVYGSLVLPKTAGIGALVLDSSFSFFAPTTVNPDGTITQPSPSPAGAIRSSIVKVGISVDVTAAIAALKH